MILASYWLLKTDPDAHSYDDLERERKTRWDGVTNNLALLHLRLVKKGDLAFVYHTGKEREIVGIGEVLSSPYPDPNGGNQRFAVIDVAAEMRLMKPVSLESMKAMREFKNFDLVRLPRLSVIPVGESMWKRILELSRS